MPEKVSKIKLALSVLLLLLAYPITGVSNPSQFTQDHPGTRQPPPTGITAPAPVAAEVSSQLTSKEGNFIPPPVDLSYLDPKWNGIQALLPSHWNWQDYGGVSAVKNQGSCGACYAFATVADLESRLLIDGAGNYDISENNAKECTWYALNTYSGGCTGGSDWWVADLFTQKGTVSESCDPYTYSSGCKTSCPFQKTLLDWLQISGSHVPSPEVLKNYILNYGPVEAAMYASFPGFSYYNGSYTLYYPGNDAPNHAVLIVGWDDQLTYTDNEGHIAHGAWIVKNSWGSYWGDNGFFYIAYGSASIGEYAAVTKSWQDYDSSGKLYYYDEGGWTYSFGYGTKTAWGMEKVIPTANSYATRVEFWMTDAGSVSISIYDSLSNPESGGSLSGLLAQATSSIGEAGYHSVILQNPLHLSVNDAVYVVVKFTTTATTYPIAYDHTGPRQSGQTYVSYNGTDGSWYDMASYYDGDLTIRLRTTMQVSAPSSLIASPISESQINLTWTDNSNNETGFEIEQSSDGVSNWVRVGVSGPNSWSYNDNKVFCQTSYFYRVRAVNTWTISDYTNTAFVTSPNCTPPQLAPSGLEAGPTLHHSIFISWIDTANETQFVIERSLDGLNGWEQKGIVPGNVTSWIDGPGLDPEQTYYYRVHAANLAGNSPLSEIVHASPYAAELYLPFTKK